MSQSPIRLAAPRESRPATPEQLLGFLIGYCRLLAARYQARVEGLDPGAAPIGSACLRRHGVTEPVLQWALFQAHVDHFHAGPASAAYAWQVRPSAVVDDRSAFALTAAGEAFAEWLISALLLPETDASLRQAWRQLRVGELAPSFDPKRRLLAWGGHALKRYRQPSENQELILLTAEELGWARWFDDPLPRPLGGAPKVRLHDAIKHLNRHQAPHLVQFRGDGTGTRVGWVLR